MTTRSTGSLLRHPGRVFILVCVFLLAGYSAYFGGRAALADAMTLKVRQDIDQWRKGQNLPPDLSLWRESRNTLVAALEYAPDNPQFYEDLAFLYGLRALAARNNTELEREFLSQVLEYYKQAASLRPMSPHTWSNIALAKHFRGENDPELWTAFDLAMSYGKNEPAVQITLAEIGRARWGELSEARRTALNAAYARAIPSLRKALETVAARYPHD